MNKLVRNALQRARFFAQRSGFAINRAEAFAFPDQAELMSDRDVRIIFDIGANNGSTVAEYRKLFPESTVHCFEAIPGLVVKIKDRFSADNNVKVHPVAVDESPGNRHFHVNRNIDTSSLLRSSVESIPSSYRSIQSPTKIIEVDCQTIDSVCSEESVSRIDILKMDIQGGELGALRGAAKMLANAAVDLIYSEVWFLPFYDDQPLFGDICSFLAQFGYSIHGIYNVGISGGTGRMTWADSIFVSPELRGRSREILRTKHGA